MEHQPDPIPTIMHPDTPLRPVRRKANKIVLVIVTIIGIVIATGIMYYFQDGGSVRELQQGLKQEGLPSEELLVTDKATLLANFSYLGKPIHPNCISESANGDGEADQYDPKNVPSNTAVNLATCSTPSSGEYDESELLYQFPDLDGFNNGLITYEPILQKGNLFVISVTSNGGGSGIFDDVEVIKKEGGAIHNLGYINAIAAGDRCNGGISSIRANKDGTIAYSVNLTPYDLIVLGDPQTKLEAYSDLEASAASCVALAGYTYNLDTNTATPSVVGIGSSWSGTSDTGKIVDQKGWTEEYKYQSCFNKVYNSYVDDNKITLDQAGVTAFATDFMKSCVKK